MQSVMLVGNLSTDVTMKRAGESDVANFFLAVNRPGQDAGADFIPVVAWNGTAQACFKYLGKGKKAAVSGVIRTRRWQDGEGKTQYGWEVSANRVEFLSPRSDSNGEMPAVVEASTPAPSDDDIPF